MQGAGCKVQRACCRVQNAVCRVQNAGCRVQGAGCRVQGAGCRVWGPGRREGYLESARLPTKRPSQSWTHLDTKPRSILRGRPCNLVTARAGFTSLPVPRCTQSSLFLSLALYLSLALFRPLRLSVCLPLSLSLYVYLLSLSRTLFSALYASLSLSRFLPSHHATVATTRPKHLQIGVQGRCIHSFCQSLAKPLPIKEGTASKS